jgi:cyclophilin family peptidyl-prolyl cis-trans isomerase
MEDVILETTMGTIVCEMYYDHAPRTCKNFVELVGPASVVLTIGETRILQRSYCTSSSSPC